MNKITTMNIKHRKQLSQILYEALDKFTGDTLTVQQLSNELGIRAYGTFLILMSLPNFIPLVSFISCTLLLFHSLQMALGVEKPWLPKFIREFSFKQATFRSLIARYAYILEKFEQLIRPRLLFMSSKLYTRLTGMAIFLLNLVLLFPIPFSNLVPSLAVMFIGFGLIQRDGLVILISALLGLIYSVFYFIFLWKIIGRLV